MLLAALLTHKMYIGNDRYSCQFPSLCSVLEMSQMSTNSKGCNSTAVYSFASLGYPQVGLHSAALGTAQVSRFFRPSILHENIHSTKQRGLKKNASMDFSDL